MRRRRVVILAAIAAATWLPSTPTWAAPVLITGDAVQAGEINKKLLKRLCLGTRSSVGNRQVIVVLPPEDSPAVNGLFESLGINAGSFERLWVRRVLSGYAAPPRRMSAQEGVLYVKSHPNAVAIVEGADLAPDVVAVEIDLL